MQCAAADAIWRADDMMQRDDITVLVADDSASSRAILSGIPEQ